jgi:glyoxylase-like metal-dependent hydrolase (beta-lactamase superfamily II)
MERPGMTFSQVIDHEYAGTKEIIATLVLDGEGGCALVDPGPSVTLPTLRAKLLALGIPISEISSLLLTHIHLDHAGATGSLVRENPRIQVHVHERGAPHLADPTKLLSSAKRLYGEAMDRMWGEFLAVPEENLHVLKGGERLRVGNREIEALYTPGHASHHVSYFDSSDGTVFVGDTAGLRLANRPLVLPVTPPPDIDLELWEASLRQIEARSPKRLFLTHFGFADRLDWHFAEFRRRQRLWAERVRESLGRDDGDEDRMAAFVRSAIEDFRGVLTGEECVPYERISGLELSWQGLARYWRKREKPA